METPSNISQTYTFQFFFPNNLHLSRYIIEFPQSWTLESLDGEDAPDSEDDVESGETSRHPIDGPVTKEGRKPSRAYQDFLQFLQLGCSESPIQGYPTVLIALSTIPSSVRPRLAQSIRYSDRVEY